MSSPERSERFLAKQATRLALAVLAFATLAVSTPLANAGVILGYGGSDCDAALGSGTCSTVQESSTGGNPGVNWVAMAGSGTATYISGPDNYYLEFTTFTDSNGAYLSAGTIPVAWNFTLSNATLPNLYWSVQFQITVGGDTYSFVQTGTTTTTGDTVSGTGSINVTAGGEASDYLIDLYTLSSAAYTVTVPGSGTLDLNPATSSTPEPGTLLLIAPGVGVLLLLGRKKLK